MTSESILPGLLYTKLSDNEKGLGRYAHIVSPLGFYTEIELV